MSVKILGRPIMKSSKRQAPVRQRYAGKILFQFRFTEDPGEIFRTTEERIIIVRAAGSGEALGMVDKYGEEAQYRFKNNEGSECVFEYVGCMELMHLGAESDDDEVWYSVRRMKLPMERKATLIPEKSRLSAFRSYED